MKAEFKTLKFGGNGGSTAAMRATADRIHKVIANANIPGPWLVATQFTDSGYTITAGRKLKSGGADIRLAVDVNDRSEFTKVPDNSNKSAVIYTSWRHPESKELAQVIRNVLVRDGFGSRRIEDDVDVSKFFDRYKGRLNMDEDGNLVAAG
jgi:hypothetical protein